MRIVVDMQGAQTESRFRGIGRYTIEFVQAVVRNRGEHEVILALSGLFPETIESIYSAFDGLLPKENFRVWYAPGPVCEKDPGNEIRREAAELIREAFFEGLQADVVHITSLFEGHVDDAVTSIGRFESKVPVSVVLYDLIPLLNPDRYLNPNPAYAAYYERKVKSLKSANLLLAISDFARREGVDTLGFDPMRVVNVSTAIGPKLYPQQIEPSVSVALKNRLDIHHSFVLYAGGADDRKNLPRLMEAWASLPLDLRNNNQLVLAGRMPEGNISELKHIASKNGVASNEIVFTGYVSDEELGQLYNLCKFFVFPSWHEGFGLPALEAMACGAPVIGANTTSLPEVIGLEEALFNPLDVASIAGKLQQALQDEDFLARLRSHGLGQAKLFSWDKTAKRAISAWMDLKPIGAHTEEFWRKIHGRRAEQYQHLIDGIAVLVTENPAISDNELRHIASCIAINEHEQDRYLRLTRLPESITWRMEGPFDSSYSLALVNREIALALTSLGHKVALHSTEGHGDFQPNQQFLAANASLAGMYRRSLEITHIDADVVSRNLYPPRVADMTARFNFMHGYAWEESGFPLGWIDDFNLSLQGMMVVSTHVQKIMVDHGLIIPMAVTWNGVDHWHRIESDSKFRLQARSFRFLHVSSCFPRKGADTMLRAYGRAFRASDDVTLVIKTFPNPHNEIHHWLDEARALDPDFPDVVILESDFTDTQLKALYEQCHALVAPSRAEGFGLPMAEAMLSGLAVITTGWGGQTDFCTPDTAWLINYAFSRAKSHFGLSASVWADPDERHLADLMKEVFFAPVEARKARSDAGRQLLNDKFCWSHVAKRMVGAARLWAQGTNVVGQQPRIGWITTWNTRCGIATYSEHLIDNMSSTVTILAAQAHAKTAEDGANVKRCWSSGDDDTLESLSREITELGLDTLVIQFNYGFFNFPTFAKFLDDQIDKGRVVVVVMHATNDPGHAPHKKMSLLVPALKGCHRVLVHSPNDMNRLKQLGMVENVALFPHGIKDYSLPLITDVRGRKEFVVASYGFFLPHKGLLELIEAIALLRDQGKHVRLEMVNAEYPAPESRNIIDKAKQKTQALQLNDRVRICTDYLSDNDSFSRLSDADLIVFPYQETGESSSAAVRNGIASGRPVAVTPIDIFDDVSLAVHTLPGTAATDIAAGISFLAERLANADASILEKESLASRWRDEHRYSKIGQRLNQMLIAIHTLRNSTFQG